jgi:hypothetical protein
MTKKSRPGARTARATPPAAHHSRDTTPPTRRQPRPRAGNRTNQATTTDASRRSHVTLSALALTLAPAGMPASMTDRSGDAEQHDRHARQALVRVGVVAHQP